MIVHRIKCDQCGFERSVDRLAWPEYPHPCYVRPGSWPTFENMDFCSHQCVADYAAKKAKR